MGDANIPAKVLEIRCSGTPYEVRIKLKVARSQRAY